MLLLQNENPVRAMQVNPEVTVPVHHPVAVLMGQNARDLHYKFTVPKFHSDLSYYQVLHNISVISDNNDIHI